MRSATLAVGESLQINPLKLIALCFLRHYLQWFILFFHNCGIGRYRDQEAFTPKAVQWKIRNITSLFLWNINIKYIEPRSYRKFWQVWKFACLFNYSLLSVLLLACRWLRKTVRQINRVKSVCMSNRQNVDHSSPSSSVSVPLSVSPQIFLDNSPKFLIFLLCIHNTLISHELSFHLLVSCPLVQDESKRRGEDWE